MTLVMARTDAGAGAGAAAVGIEVTKGYVPWSRSRNVACAPLEEDVLTGLQRLVDEADRVVDVRRHRGASSPR